MPDEPTTESTIPSPFDFSFGIAPIFNPYDWYWLADDSRVYSSYVQATLADPANDTRYQNWLTAGYVPTPWPRDDAGNQTNASIGLVLAPYQLALDLKYYARQLRDQVERSGFPVTGIAGMTAISSDDYSQNQIERFHEIAAVDASFNAAWVLMGDRSTVTLAKADIDNLYGQFVAFLKSNWDIYTSTVHGIDGGTITTRQQVDAAWGLGTTFKREWVGKEEWIEPRRK
jgi:hypothetical protein